MIGLLEEHGELISMTTKKWNLQLSNLFCLSKNNLQSSILKNFPFQKNLNSQKDKQKRKENSKVILKN